MPAKGTKMSREHADRIGEAARDYQNRQRRIAAAGDKILVAAADGDDEQIAAVAREQLAALREDGWVTKLVPPGREVA